MTPGATTPSKLAILLLKTGPDDAATCAAPFVFALAATALDCEVEMHFAGPSVRLLLPGIADAIHSGRQQSKSIGDFMREAASNGVHFYGCAMAMAEHLSAHPQRIPEFTGASGATAFIQRTLDPAWRTLIF